MEEIRSYEEMEKYVRSQIENSWDFITTFQGCIYMSASIKGSHDRYNAYVRWIVGEEAEEEAKRKAVLEAESLFEFTYEDAVSMQYSDDLEEHDLLDRFFARVRDNEDDFWEAEYMAAMDDPETEENIKSLAVDLWKQWKEYELDE